MSEKKATAPTLDPKDLAFWRTEIKAARQKRTDVSEAFGWKKNLENYVPRPLKTGVLDTHVNTGSDFRDVERKKAALFYDTPAVCLTVKQDREIVPDPNKPDELAAMAALPKPLMLSTLTFWEQEMLNTLLGPQHANVKPTVLKAIFDCLCPSGLGPVTVGYQVTMKTIDQPTPLLDPITQQPVMEPVNPLHQAAAAFGMMPPPMPKPVMTTVKVEIPIYERWFVSHFSPMSMLIPASFKDTDYQRAPWLGKDFRKPTSQIKREYHLPKDWAGGTADESIKTTFEEPNDTKVDVDAAGDPELTGSEIYYRTQLRSDKEEHPDALMHLVLLDGKAEPLVHRPCPYQDFTETGEMSPDSLKGFVDRPLVLRDLSDSAWIPSDCSVWRQLTTELEKFREQSIKQRKNSRSVILFDASKIDPTARDKIENGEIGAFVPVIEGALQQGVDTIMKQVAQPTLGRENFLAQEIIESDREKISGIGSNQTGIQAKGAKTATEQTIVQRNSEARFEQERQRVLAWFLNDVAQPFDTLILRYADDRIAMQILGDVRGKLWATFKGHLAGGYSYGLMVDSGKYLDIEADRRQWMQVYGQLRQDPMVNPRPLLTKLAEIMGLDPAEFVVEPKKPEKEMKASVSFKATEDFNPANPAFAINVALARQAGWIIDEEAVKIAQGQAVAVQTMQPAVSGVGPHPTANGTPQHPGTAPKAPTINQHVQDESGDRSGPKVSVN